MAASAPNPTVLRKILLATDLSARGDRALDRAVSLAADSQAQLLILHVTEEFEESSVAYGRYVSPSWRAPPDAVEIARQHIREGLKKDIGDAVAHATVLVLEGETVDVIEQVVTTESVDLIVTGIAREGLFATRPVILGRTVENLLRRVGSPILIVRNRPRTAYRHILVTTDFSDTSANALQVAASFFPDRKLRLLHAFDMPRLDDRNGLPRQIERFKNARDAELKAFVTETLLPEDARRRVVRLVEYGKPAQLVRDYLRNRGADLVVFGTRGRGAVMETLIGSTAKSILQSLSCDALVVRGPTQRAPRAT